MDAADFLALSVEDDRALGHRTDLREIVFLRADAVNDGQEGQPVDACDEGITDEPCAELRQRAKPAGEQIEEMEWPEQQQRGSSGAAAGGRFLAVAVGIRRVAFWHLRAKAKRSRADLPSLFVRTDEGAGWRRSATQQS